MKILCLEESMFDEVDREESKGKVTRERERERLDLWKEIKKYINANEK